MISTRNNSISKDFKKLKTEVETHFGRNIICTKDCQQLQQEISDYTLSSSLGLNTIRRCFGIIKADTKLSKYSLDILSIYCGYEDYNHFISSPSDRKLHEQPINLSLIKTLYGESLEQQETQIFKKLHLEIFEAILTDSSLFQSIYPKLVHYPLFQEYVLSFHPLIDKLNQEWYMKAIRVFTSRSNITHLKVFGISMEFLLHFLNDDLGKCKRFIDEMRKLEGKLVEEYPLVVWPQARLYASAYIYYSKIGNYALANDYELKIKHSCCKLGLGKKTSQQEQENAFDFLMCVTDYLSLAGEYGFGKQLLKDFGKSFENGHLITSRLYHPYKTIIGIIEAEHYAYSGNRQEAKKAFKQIDLSKLTFEFKSFYTFRYLLLQLELSTGQATPKFLTVYKQAKAVGKELGYKSFIRQLNTVSKR